MSDNDLLNCDWEYEYSRDEIFYMERQQQIEHEYYMWEQQNRKPAEIKVIIKKPKHETDSNPLPF